MVFEDYFSIRELALFFYFYNGLIFLVYAYKSFWIYAIKLISNVGRNNFSLPIYLSWNIDVDLCHDFKSPNMQIYFFSLLCLLLAVRDTKHSPRDVQMDTRNETRLSWLQWSLLNFWFLNYCRPCLSYLLLSFLEGLRLHIWFFSGFFLLFRVSVWVILSCALRTGASNPLCMEQLPWRAAGTGVFQAGESFWAWSLLLCTARHQKAALPGRYQNPVNTVTNPIIILKSFFLGTIC